ncbi:glycosyltransferase [Paenibacillus sp. LHD-117]|uniref:glycosyltransferase n=1 Tax=Paenibacillus sp. LHD-117 TaxID=3071412 RepID=UPI0027E001FF|nr:glycosyltransferase [Paenibacillus sp. LHD-117]MDQ6418333.1 glycosyltransferase [Paenibacillus sp. LHD-117]
MNQLRVCKLIRRHSFLDVRVCRKQARSLAAMGHDVTIMAPRMNGALLDVNRQPLPRSNYGGEHFDLDGIHIRTYRARHIVPNLRAMLETLRGHHYGHVPDGLFAAALDVSADVYHAHEPETLYEAVLIKRKLAEEGRSVKVVFDAHELEADTTVLRQLMLEADHLITVSRPIATIYAKRHPHIPISLIYNSPEWVSEEELGIGRGAADRGEIPFVIGYEGMITKAKGNPAKIKAVMDRLSDEGLNIRFKVLGKVQMVKRGEQKEWENFLRNDPRFDYGWVNFDSLTEQWKDVDAGYIYFDLSTSNRHYALPNKFFSLLNSGVPVVVNAAAAMGAVVREHQCGIVLPGRNPSSSEYAEAFKQLYGNPEQLAEMGRNAREAIRTTFGWQEMEKRLGDIYAGL